MLESDALAYREDTNLQCVALFQLAKVPVLTPLSISPVRRWIPSQQRDALPYRADRPIAPVTDEAGNRLSLLLPLFGNAQ